MSQPDDTPVLPAGSDSLDSEASPSKRAADVVPGPGRYAGRQFQTGDTTIENVKSVAAENPIVDEALMDLSADLPSEGGVQNRHENVRTARARSARR